MVSKAYTKRKKFFDTPYFRKRMKEQMRLRKQAEKEGRVSEGDGKEIDHSDGNYRNNSRGNLKILSAHENRTKDRNNYSKGGKGS